MKIEKYCFYSLCCLLIWLPIPLGSNRVWAWTISELWIAFTAFTLFLELYRHKKDQILDVLNSYRWFLLPFSLFQVWVFVQLLPIPLTMLQVISPNAFSAYLMVDAPYGYLSLDPGATYISWLKGMNYLLFSLIVILTVHTTQRIKWLMMALIISGTFQAIYGATNVLIGTTHSWVFNLSETNIATGSFVYKNHLANYLLMCICIGIGLIVADLNQRNSSDFREILSGILSSIMSTKMLSRLAIITMVITLVMTRSRMGNSALFAATMLSGIIALMVYKDRPATLKWLLVSIFAIDVLILSSFFGLEQVRDRIVETSMTEETRYLAFEWGVDIVRDFWLTGSGMGSFAALFPSYTQRAIGYYDHAHNDYLQFVIEAGLPATLLLAYICAKAIILSIATMRFRHSQTCKGAAFAGLTATIAMLIHISVDFNLQAPANALTFITILLLIGAAHSVIIKRRKRV